MVANKIGWGIAGCGWVARDYIAPAIAQAGNAQLLAGYDPDPGAHLPGVATQTDLARFLATPGLQAVYVAAPNHVHRALVEAAAAAGKPVLCEKPMATSLHDARAMVQACRAANTAYATAFDQRFHAAHQHIAHLVQTGAIGTVTAIRIVYACWLDKDWAADNWRIDPARAGGGAMIDLAPHGLDLASMILADELEDIAALGHSLVQDYAVDDGALLMARGRRGALVQLHVAYNCPDALPRRRLEVVGTRGQIVALNTMGQVGGGTVQLTDAAGVARDVAVPDLDRSPFAAMVAAFSGCLLQQQAFPFTPDHDLHVMDLLSRAQAMLAPALAKAG